jgi:hypothetical protein
LRPPLFGTHNGRKKPFQVASNLLTCTFLVQLDQLAKRGGGSIPVYRVAFLYYIRPYREHMECSPTKNPDTLRRKPNISLVSPSTFLKHFPRNYCFFPKSMLYYTIFFFFKEFYPLWQKF